MYSPAYEDIVLKGLENVNTEFKDEQENFLAPIIKKIRGVDYGIVKLMEPIFVQDLQYASKIFNSSQLGLREYDFVDNSGNFRFYNQVMFPLYDVTDRIVAMIGYDPFQKVISKHISELTKLEELTKEQEEDLDYSKSLQRLKYMLPTKVRVDIANYLYFPKGGYKKALEDDYVVIVDGFFDCLNLIYHGINAVCTMGSKLSPARLLALSFIKHKFIAVDNDNAGDSLYRLLRSNFPVTRIINKCTSDIDEYITEYGVGDLKERIDKSIKSYVNLDIILTKKDSNGASMKMINF